jgi:CheY-like chemotaxis protein
MTAPEPTAAATSPKTVLVVDDDADLRADGTEALAYLRTGARPCMILLDLMMPGMNGWEFRSEQLQDPRLADIRTVVITAQPAVRMAPIQADQFLFKPVRLEELLSTVEQLCGKPGDGVPG